MAYPKQLEESAEVSSAEHQQQLPSQDTTPSSRSLLPRVLLYIVLVLTMLCKADTLSCYETVKGQTAIKQDDKWLFCSLVPATTLQQEHRNGTRFGLGPENDELVAYKAAFGLNEREYRVLTVCVYERIDFSRFLRQQPDTSVEFAFRCVCNYDLCNSEPTFYPYLKTIKEESYIVKK